MVAHWAIPVPQGASWDAALAGFELPEPVAAALDRAGGALVRTIHRYSADDDSLTALAYHRPGTAQEKLTALSGEPSLLAPLADAVSAALSGSGGISLKLELPFNAVDLAEAAQRAGFDELKRPASAAPPPSADQPPPRGFVRRLGGWQHPELSYYRQSTEFTCGPVAALTAAHGLGLSPQLTREAELQLWREATSAPGCDPYGLAAGLLARGVRPSVVVNTEDALQVELSPAAWQRDLRTFTQRVFTDQLRAEGVRPQHCEFDVAELAAAVDTGRVVLLLIDEALMHGEPCPHWVVVYGRVGSVFLVEDPWTDADLGETWVDAHELAVSTEAVAAMSGWGDYRAYLALEHQAL